MLSAEAELEFWERFNSAQIRGSDNRGRLYASLEELMAVQEEEKAEYYRMNDEWWTAGGCGGDDDHAMLGDERSEEDLQASRTFFDGWLRPRLEASLLAAASPLEGLPPIRAMDVGAGVGRVVRGVLGERCALVHLVEASAMWSERSKAYVCASACACTFDVARIEAYLPSLSSYELVWVQGCLQDLTDLDVIQTLTKVRCVRAYAFSSLCPMR
jgi:hypothetical protein